MLRFATSIACRSSPVATSTSIRIALTATRSSLSELASAGVPSCVAASNSGMASWIAASASFGLPNAEICAARVTSVTASARRISRLFRVNARPRARARSSLTRRRIGAEESCLPPNLGVPRWWARADAHHGVATTLSPLQFVGGPVLEGTCRRSRAASIRRPQPCFVRRPGPSVRPPPEGRFHLDLLTRLGELYDLASLESERVTLAGVSVSVVTRKMLYRMKKATVHSKDWADAAAIVDEFGPQED